MKAMLKILSFRLTADDFERLNGRDLALGLACTWMVGMGRYWDDPTAALAQKLGLGSLGYVLFLALAMWAVIAPLRPKHWTYARVLTFVTLTSAPGILYAIPVEQFLGNHVAYELNVSFLVIVALWRLAMVLVQIPRCTRAPVIGTFSAVLWPICAVSFVLAMNQVLAATVRVMGGLRDRPPTAPWNTIAGVSFWSGLVFFLVYVAISLRRASKGSPPPASCPALESPSSSGRSLESKEPRSSAAAAPPPV